jgi:hypothetical protein
VFNWISAKDPCFPSSMGLRLLREMGVAMATVMETGMEAVGAKVGGTETAAEMAMGVVTVAGAETAGATQEAGMAVARPAAQATATGILMAAGLETVVGTVATEAKAAEVATPAIRGMLAEAGAATAGKMATVMVAATGMAMAAAEATRMPGVWAA